MSAKHKLANDSQYKADRPPPVSKPGALKEALKTELRLLNEPNSLAEVRSVKQSERSERLSGAKLADNDYYGTATVHRQDGLHDSAKGFTSQPHPSLPARRPESVRDNFTANDLDRGREGPQKRPDLAQDNPSNGLHGRAGMDSETKEELKDFIRREINGLRLDIIKELELQKAEIRKMLAEARR